MKAKITNSELCLVIANSFLILFLIGGVFNYIVVTNNDNLMPVLYESEYKDDSHFSYQNPLTIKYWILSDVIYLLGNILSIGDSFLLIGMIGHIFFLFLFIKTKIKFKTRRKK